MVQTVKITLLKETGTDLSEWDKYCSIDHYYLNTKVATVHNSTPYSLMFARPINGFNDYKDGSSQPLVASGVVPAVIRSDKSRHKHSHVTQLRHASIKREL